MAGPQADGPTETPLRLERFGTAEQTPILKAACCKICRKGKACGDSCISRERNCSKARGCACDG